MPKKVPLSAALNKAAEAPATAKAARLPRREPGRVGAQAGAKTYREGMVNVTGYFPPGVKASLRLIQAKHPEMTVQDLLAEALTDLFAKYNVPQTARGR